MYIIYEMYALKTYLKSRIQIEINSIICFYNGKKIHIIGRYSSSHS